MLTVRYLPFESRTPAGNMAADESLMLSASELGIASFRFYTWDVPTLSLGYFQPAASRIELPAWVRRATGGDAIVHDPACEITYSLALPEGVEWQPPGIPWICKMHYILRDALKTLGVESRAVICGEEQKLEPVLCFQHQTAGDLLVSGRKVAGSAQRKWKGALLQHGSILFRQSPFAPSVHGIAELSGITVEKAEFIAAVEKEFPRATGYTLVPGNWKPEELATAARFEQEKYDHPNWNEKR
jgi:lipoyl(octanoyl) transferase